MNRVLLFIAKIINNVFGYSMGKYRYFKSWKYIHTISLMEKGEFRVIRSVKAVNLMF